MALGNYDNNSKQKDSLNVYSPYKMSNTEGIDPSALNFTFCIGMLKMSISPKKPGDQIAFDHDKAIGVYLTHVKAKMLSDEIKYMLKHKGEVHNVSVSTGKDGLVTFSDGQELQTNKYTLLIRTIDENGVPTTNYAYEFKDDYHFSMRNYDPNNPSAYDKVMHDTIEIDMFLNLLDEYYRAWTGADGYIVANSLKYWNSKVNTKIESIMEKMGIDITKNGNYSHKQNNNSFFNNNSGNNNYRQSSLDELSNAMNTPEDIDD